MKRRALLGAGLGLALAPAARADTPWPGALTMGTGRPGGAFMVYGPAWGRLAAQATGIDIAYRVTGGASSNLLLIEEGTAQLGLATATVALQALTGSSGWTAGVKLRNFRALFPAYNSVLQIVSPRANGITRLGDLDGQILGVGPDGASGAAASAGILASLGIHAGGIITGDYGQQVADMLAGKLGAIAFIGAPPLPAIAQAATGRKLNLIGFSQAEADLAGQLIPGLSLVVLPPGTFPGQDIPVSTIGTANIAVGAASLPNSLAAALTTAALTHRKTLAAALPAAAIPPALPTHIPIHPGAAPALRAAGYHVPDSAIEG